MLENAETGLYAKRKILRFYFNIISDETHCQL